MTSEALAALKPQLVTLESSLLDNWKLMFSPLALALSPKKTDPQEVWKSQKSFLSLPEHRFCLKPRSKPFLLCST